MRTAALIVTDAVKAATIVLLLTVSVACVSSRVQLDPKWDRSVKPVYVDYFDHYFFGFVGNPSVNLQKACMDQKPYGVQAVKTPEDGVITFSTLGIYSPTTVRVWCGD